MRVVSGLFRPVSILPPFATFRVVLGPDYHLLEWPLASVLTITPIVIYAKNVVTPLSVWVSVRCQTPPRLLVRLT